MTSQDIKVDASVWARLEQALDAHEFLRVGITSGGCFGFQYTFATDTKVSDQDVVITKKGCRVVIAQKYMPFLAGGTLTFEQDMMRSQFAFHNPKVTQGCGCGISFSIPEE